MIALQKIILNDSVFLKKIRKIYETAFPPIERRAFKEVMRLLSDNKFSLFAITFENEVVGMLSKWDFDTFIYIEHLAISTTFRGNGLGTHILQNMMQEDSRQIILEVEIPEDEISLKRIQFYERLGFSICQESYTQPPYDQTKDALPMLIMAKPGIDTAFEFQTIQKTLHQQVYHFFEK